jgi:hypothetical protein
MPFDHECRDPITRTLFALATSAATSSELSGYTTDDGRKLHVLP